MCADVSGRHWKEYNQEILSITIETHAHVFKYLSGSHVYISLIYNFLIVVPNKHLIPPIQNLIEISKMWPTNQLSIILYRYISIF